MKAISEYTAITEYTPTAYNKDVYIDNSMGALSRQDPRDRERLVTANRRAQDKT
jgi:hypothetical protein